jgi:hypothetical protein
MRRRTEPPVRPEPFCLVCGSYEVTEQSTEAAAPLCGEHDVGVRAERIALEEALADAQSDIAHLRVMLEAERVRESLMASIERTRRRRDRLQEELERLREECPLDHSDDSCPSCGLGGR